MSVNNVTAAVEPPVASVNGDCSGDSGDSDRRRRRRQQQQRIGGSSAAVTGAVSATTLIDVHRESGPTVAGADDEDDNGYGFNDTTNSVTANSDDGFAERTPLLNNCSRKNASDGDACFVGFEE